MTDLCARTYTLQASAGDFILGEVGRIDNTGQTVQVGVVSFVEKTGQKLQGFDAIFFDKYWSNF